MFSHFCILDLARCAARRDGAARHVQQEASSDMQASRSRQPGSDHSDVLYVCAAGRAIRAASVPGHALLLKNHAIVLKDFQVKA